MNGPFQVAQANIAGQTAAKSPARIVKIAKPFSDQSVVVALSYDGSVKADLSAIAGEKITLVHIGEKLIILFDNKSTVTLEPFFDSTGKPLDSLTVEVSPGRSLTGAEFAALFPVTEDQSVLPAAGDGNGNAQASGANFSSVGVDPLALSGPLDLLGQEELPNFVITDLLRPAADVDLIPSQIAGARVGGVTEEEQLGGIISDGPSIRELLIQLNAIDSGGKEDPNDVTLPNSNGAASDGLDQDTPEDSFVTTQFFHGDGANALTNLVASGNPPLTFTIDAAIPNSAVVDGTGAVVKSAGHELHYSAIDTSVAGDNTIVGGYSEGEGGFHEVFRLTIHSDGTYDFELLDKIDHPVHTTDAGSTSNGHLEETLFLDFTTLVHVADLDGEQFTLTGTGAFTIGVIDDTPEVSVAAADTKPLSLASLDESIGTDLGDSNADTDDTGNTAPDPLGVNSIGEVESAPGALANLFSVTGTTGEDGFGSVDFTFTLTLGGASQNGGVATSLSVTDPNHVYGSDSTIYLFNESGEIVGRVGSAQGAIALRILIDGSGGSDPTTAQLVVDQYLPVNHGSDGNDFDSSKALTLVGDGTLGVTLTTTVTDGDGDVATSAATVTIVDNETSPINIEDDGPTITAGEGGETAPLAVLDLDETIGADRYNTGETESSGGASNGVDDKAATVTVSIAPLAAQAIGELSTGTGALAGLFTAAGVDFGTDGPAAGGGITYELSLVLSSETVGTSLTATALVGTPLGGMTSGQRAIELVQVNATTIEGRLVGDGIAANGDEYVAFRITLENPNDPATAKITVDQFLAIDHGGSENPSVFDEQTLLTLVGNGALDLKLVTTVTDGDGDHASLPVQVNLIGAENSFIAFDDDGPKPLSISSANGAANGLFFDGFVPNNDAWGAGSGINNSGTAGAWHIATSPYEGASTIQLERVGDNYRGSDSPTNSVMVDLEATPGNVQVSQDLTLTPGAVYHLTFEIGAANDPGIADSAKLEVFWNGTSVGIYTPTSGVMQTISIDVTASGANNQLTFREIGEAGDNTGTFLANVKLSDVIIIDETKGVDADSDDTTGLGALFTTVTNGGPVGVDPDMDQPQYAQGLHSVVVLGTADFGTDGAAATNPIQIGLSVSSAGVDSGLTTTEGKAIHLYVEGALVVGRFDSDNNSTYDTAAFALSIDPNGGILSIAQYVSLHHLDITSNDEGVYLANGSLLATVTLTDGDGDRTTTSADISSAVRFEDDGPSIDPLQNSSLRDWTIDEDVLPAAGHSTPIGNDALDSPADTNDYTQINDKPLGVTWGADGPKALTFAATDSQHPTITVTDQNGNPQPPLTSGGVALVYNITTNADGGQTLIAYKGSVSPANEVFTLTLDPDAGTSGTFSFELTGALDHPIAGGQNTLNLRFGFTATDGDGDTATSSLTMRITDDVPYASNTVISRRVDEDDIDTPWSQGTSQNDGDADGSITENSTGAAFISGTLAGLVAPGADLPGKFAFTSNAVAQLTALGLFSKESALGNGENGKPLGYVISNGPVGSNEIVITGNEPNPQGNPVFSLTLNTVTGAYEFRLFDELIHMPGNGQNDDLRSGQPSGSPLVQNSIPYLDLGSIITYTDKDGDTVNLGGKFTVTITDDAPHADIDINRNASVTIDETGGNEANNTSSSSVRNLFKNLENSGIVGDDPDVGGDSNGGGVAGNGAIAYAHSNFAIVSDNSTIGSDSPPYPRQYALSIVGGAASGLFVTDGNPINLSVNADGLVIGTVGGNPAGAFYGKVAFAIAIESDGEVSVAQYLSLKHDDRGDSNETNDSGSGGNDASPDDTPNPIQQTLDGKILVTLTVTDSDGDQSTDTANIGKLITFLDDGPSLHSNSTVSLEDDDLPGGNEGGPGDDSAPDDETGTLNHDYGADGAGSTLLTGVNLPSGLGFTSSVSSDGLSLIIKQNGVDVLKITLSDFTDGDYTVTQLNAIDHPTQNGQNGDDTENNVEFTVSYRVTDGDGDFTDGSLKINVDDDTPEPNFVLQSGKLVVIDETAGLQNATATPGVTGDSNDTDTGNPFPVAVTNPGVPAADSTLFGAPQVAQSNGAVVAVTPHYGADGPGNIAFAIDVPGSSTSSGLTTVSGQPITLFEVNANLIVGRYDGPDGGGSVGTNDPAAFAIHIDPTTGVISVVQYVAIKHDDRGDFDENNDDGSNGNDASPNDSPNPVQQSIIDGAIRVTVTVTDHDSDSADATYNIGSKIVFEDDGPTISITATGEAGVVLATQDADTIGAATDTDVSAANFSGVFATSSSFGADGGGSINLGYSLAVTGTPGAGGRVDSNLDSHGDAIYLYNVGGTIIGSTSLTSGGISDGNKIFSISVNSSGVVTLSQFQQIDHPIGDDPSASASPFNDQNAILGNGLISLTRSGSITDGDGDTATSSATIDLGGNIRFTDHGPSATTTAPLKVDEDDLSTGNHDTTSPGDDTASASLTGTLGFTPGADSPATVSFLPLGGTPVVDANGLPVTAGGVALTYLWVAGTNTLYASTDGTVGGAAFKIEVTNPSTGAYSFSLLGPVDHPGHDNPGVAGTQTAFEDNININLTYTITDFDKDTATGTLSISIDDDMPIVGASPAPTNLILNGSFEDHGPVSNPGFSTFTTINHWTSGPDNVPFEIQQGNIGDLAPQQGNAKVELDSDPLNNPTSQLNATIQQTISTPLAAGDSYELSFWYSPRPNDGNPDSSSLKVYWNGVVVHTIDSSTQADGWQHVSVVVTAQAGSNTVAFQGDGQPNQLGAYLDNVSLVPAITVDEDGLTGPLATGNHDSQPGDNVVPNTEGVGVDNNEATATGNLNIKWGADDLDSGLDGESGLFNSFVQDKPNGIGDRSVTFTDATVAVTGVPTLYSHGDLVTFELNADHTVLSGKANGRTVFEVSLTDEGTGKFRFVLLDKLDHAPGNNENDIGLSFNFTATDSDGDAVSGTFVVGVDDDVPVAHDDTYSPTITGPTIISGLFGNDAFGADGVDTTNATPGQVTVTNGAHGTVAYNNDGTFTYTPNAGYSGADSFTYTIKDGDKDVSTATVTLASIVTNTIPTAGEAFATVDDEGLAGGIDGNGQSTGDVTGHAFTASGVLPHSFVNDGPAATDPINFSLANNVAGFVGTEAVTYHWDSVTNTLTATSAGRGDIFKVVVDGGLDNGNGNYVFTLLKSVLHAAGDGENDATVVLNYQVVDGTTPADTATGTLTVTIDDDTPTTSALADSVSVNEGNLPSDRHPVPANPVGIAQSDTGFLHINWGADGGSAKHLEFAKDGNSNPIGPSLTADGVPLLYVIRAPGDSSGNEQIVAYKQGDDPDTNPVFSITLYEGGNGYYTYVQYQNIDHNGVGADSKTFGFTINAFDADGDAVSQTLTINVADDTPSAVANTNSVTEGGLLTVNAAGGVLTNDTAGADGYAAGGGVVGVRAAGGNTTTAVTTGVNTDIAGLHGTLHLNADGSYTYQSTANDITSNTTDVFVYTIKDGDGDLSTTTLTINLSDVTIVAPADNDALVYEAALDTTVTGSDLAAGTVTGSLGVTSPAETDATNQLNATGGVGALTYALVGSATGTYGTIQVNANGSYVYTLTKPYDTNPEADNSTNTEENRDSFTYKVTDANGNTSTGTITVDIVDDVPTVAIDNSGPADPTTVAEAGTITGDWSLTPGADGVLPADFKVSIDNGAAAAVSVGTAINTGKGLLTFNANGTWTFVAATNLDNDIAQSVTFTLSAKDGDGDTSTDSHTISVTDGTNPSLSGGDLSLQMDDQNLSDGSTPANPDFATGTVSFTAGSDALTSFAFAAGTGALAGGLTWNRVSNTLIEGWDGAVGTGTKIVALTLTPPGSIAVGSTGSVTVTATLVNNYDSHPTINLDDLAALGSIGVVASDHDGESVTQTVTLSVSDDLPALNIVDTPATVNEGQTINGTWTLAPGADGVTSVDVTVNATTQSLSLTPSTNVVTFNLATGTLTVDADLQWHFTANSVTSNQQVTFSIKATDGDNDTSSDSQTITIQNVIQPLVITGAVTGVVEEEHALPGGIDDTTSGTTPTNLDTDAGNLNSVTNAISGSFGTLVSGGVDGTLSYSFATLSGNPAVNTVANGPLTSDGKPVLFAMDGGNLIGYVNSDGGTGDYSSGTDTKIFTVTLNSTSGAYSFTLNARVDHPIHNDSTEDAIAINLDGRVTVTDSGGPAPGDTNKPLNASITVIDDTPVAVSEYASVNEGQKPTMNVVFVIDTSGSMGSGAGSRMELAKSAAATLLNNSSVDFNQIMVVSFASGASNNTPVWADKADAIAYINGLSADGNTDYDAALERVTTNWGSGPTAADQTVVYFISDGEPTDDNGTGTVGIVGAEQTAWETFLADKGVAASYAVGISTGVNDADLTPIAWAPGNPGLPPVIITGAGDLSTTLTGSLPGSVSGNVLANGDGFGADTGHIKSITVNGTTYTFDGNAMITTSGNAPGAGDVINANGKQITIITNLGGKLVFNFAANGTNQAGEWDYTAPNNIAATSSETFAYTLTDDDGDTVGATLNLTVNNINAAPSGTNNVITALEDTPLTLTAANFGFTDPNDSPGNALQAVKITTLETAGSLKLNGVDVALGQVISAADINAGFLTFKGAQNANGAAYASFTFQVQDNGGTANGGIDLDPTPNTMTINVTAVNDTPVAAASQGTYSATEQVNLNLHGMGLSINDTADGNSGSMTVTLSVGEGTLTVAAGNSGITAGNIVGSGTSSVTITGTVTQINNLLAGTDTGSGSGGTIVYNDNTNAPSASTTLTLLVNDNGNTGVDPGLTGTASNEQASITATINIAAVNDAPSLVVHDSRTFNVQDQFSSASYSLNTGSASWSSSWTESESTSPTAGDVQIMDDPGVAGTNLTLRLGDDSNNGDSWIQRSANLSGATSATLSFDYRQADPGNNEDLIVQAWNGSAFVEIGRIDGSDSDGSDTFSVNLGAAYISSNTIIRLVADGDLDSGEYYYVDNVNINYTLPVTFTENGAAVVLDSSADVSDPELDVANNYNGATLTLARDGGASTQDQFGASGTLLFSGGNVILGGVNVGSLVNANGTLVITFNANATSARVDQVLQQITYANSSDTPPASVQIDYTFSDGNSGSQGTGGALSATGSITVVVNAVNDAPVAGHDNVVTNAAVNTAILIPMPALLVNDSDPEGQAISVNFAGAVQSGGVATLSSPNINFTHTAASGSFSYTASDGSLSSNPQTVGVTTIAGATFVANAASQILIGNNSTTTYQFSTNDGNDAIRDLGGTDAIQITTAVTSLLDFERTGNHLSVNVDQTTVTAYDHYSGQAIETVAFNAGGAAYGFSLGTSTYNLSTGLSGANNASDVVAGTSSDETLSGGTGTGTDLLFGNGGNDTLNATGSGNHLLVGGTGADTLNGGSDNDVYGFDLTDGTDTITDTGGTDAIFVRTLGAALNALNAFDSDTDTSDGNLVIQYNGQQVTVNNHFDSDTSAVETISFDGGSVYGYDLGTTSYTINNDDPGNSGVFRTVSVASGNNFIAGENANRDLITGGTGKDLLFGGTQDDTLNGGAGNDLLVGGGGADTLNGGGDNDVLVGGIGNDILDGGAGLDRFFYNEMGTSNQDTINNYNGTGASKDVIDLSGLLDAAFGPSSDIDNFIKVTDTGANAVVQIDTTGSGNFTNAGNVATLTGYGTVGNSVSVYLEGAEHQVQVTV